MDYEYYRDFHEYLNIGKNIAFIHYHKAIETVYVLDGYVKVGIGEQSHILRKGDFILVPPYQPHVIDPNNTAITQVNIIPSVYSDLFMQSLEKYTIQSPVLKDKPIAADIAEHLRMLAQKPSGLLKKGIYHYCLARYIDNIGKIFDERSKSSAKQQNFFYRVLIYIEEHSEKELTLEELAKRFNYSKYYFSSLFNRHLHSNLKNYLNNIRVRKAIDLLQDHTVTETAFLVGYTNLQTFFYNFKQITHHSPKEYMHLIAKAAENSNTPDTFKADS